MLCPKCSVKLERTQYEHFGIRQCPRCHGMLMRRDRVQAIRNRRETPPEALVEEIAQSPADADAQHRLRCPECRVTMRKERRRMGPTEFWVDVCPRCDLIWLDVGELAMLQLAFELSEQGAERLQIRERLQKMSPVQREELQRRIDSLPEYDAFRNLLTIDF
ncbi:MAG: hypothetical protein KatS3mg111_2551 [Pirellulaceae bacterium]|nr:MAG: hypothetical protein KatS3mg111_2551 [Pirellulaceae bacterium]